MARYATIVVDLQNEYLPTGKLPLAGLDLALGNAARIIAAARARDEPVIHVRHESNKPGNAIFAPGTDNVRIVDAVAALDGEAVVVKHYPNSFRETGLRHLLEELGVTHVTVIGAMSHMCIEATARAAADLGYEVTVVHDACATLDLAFGGQTVPAAHVHAASMAALAFAYATVIGTDEHLAA